MENLPKMAGTEATFEAGGVTYTVKPPNIGDMAAFQSHIRVMRLRDYLTAMELMERQPNPDTQKEILSSAITQDELEAEANTLAGMQFVMYRCLRHNPGVTLDTMSEIVTTENLAQVDALISSLGGAVENPPEVAAKKAKAEKA